MSSTRLIIFLSVLLVVYVIVYVRVVMQKHVKKGNERCEKMLKDLEDAPYNETIGEGLYGAKTKKCADEKRGFKR